MENKSIIISYNTNIDIIKQNIVKNFINKYNFFDKVFQQATNKLTFLLLSQYSNRV